MGYEAGNEQFTVGRSLPWLQDTADVDVVGTWQPTYRDVIILDANNDLVTTYNLTDHDLALSGNYLYLKDLLMSAASE